MVKGGVKTAHKCAGLKGSFSSHTYIHQDYETESYSLPNGKYGSPIIFTKDGRDPKREIDSIVQQSLEALTIREDHDYSRTPSWRTKYQGGLALEEFSRFKRVGSLLKSIPGNSQALGETQHRPICISPVSSSTGLHVLETGPGLSSSRSTSTGLDK